MPDVVFKKVDYTLKKLVEDIDIGEIGLPISKDRLFGQAAKCGTCLTQCIVVIR